MRAASTVFAVLVSLLGVVLVGGAAVCAGYSTVFVLTNYRPNPAAFGSGAGLAVGGGLCLVAAAIALRGDDKDGRPPDGTR